MLISKKYRFVFIHIPKTAGTSIHDLLSRIDEDAITPSPLKTHSPARYVCSYLTQQGEEPGEYYFFSFVRNPFERLHSLYHFIQVRWPEKLEGKDFNAWLFSNEEIYEGRQTFPGESAIPNTQKPQLDWLTSTPCKSNQFPLPKIIPKFIGRYENLKEDLEHVFSELKIGTTKEISDLCKFHLPHMQDHKRPKDYRKIYNEQGRKWVEKYFQVDLEYSNYSF
ncbi:hypothetical protein LCGC14_0549750 [marine sediment metagenome]|uniref:Sulfotransferase domain-containing protein n=1 Tax=marine sediment metagenome TaxID=412755 RepID=A0A0F9UYH8_9ZZZZ